MKYILSLDQGTTSSRAIIFDKNGHAVSSAQKELAQYYPKAGWVEHDAVEIWASQIGVAKEAMQKAGIEAGDIASIGIANQRETTVVWDKNTGRPVCNAIVWQCKRTAGKCSGLIDKGYGEMFQNKTGLRIDAYFSATKLAWVLENRTGVRSMAEKGEVLFGTVETWLIWNLTGGRIHVTDYSNASRTMLFNIHTLDWDDDILKLLNIPRAMLPQVKPSSVIYGYSVPSCFGGKIAVSGCAGDQQAALFGQRCYNAGDVKNTYGTGAFLLMNTGNQPVKSEHGLLTTIAWGIDEKITYALEGSVFIAGAAVQWLRDEMGLVKDASETEAAALSVENTNGVYFVPAFVGLGAPYWNPNARGTITGLTRGSNRSHIIRAALESICYQTAEVMSIMADNSSFDIKDIRVDGGASGNNFIMQFQADILNRRIIRPEFIETTALGAAFLAGLAVGFWQNADELCSLEYGSDEFMPDMEEGVRNKLLQGWLNAVKQTINN